jgi:hypothetical protein
MFWNQASLYKQIFSYALLQSLHSYPLHTSQYMACYPDEFIFH